MGKGEKNEDDEETGTAKESQKVPSSDEEDADNDDDLEAATKSTDGVQSRSNKKDEK